ncbi:CPBP family intramembrane metalloprotease (plasmid) [Phormidium sp. CLA17]|uniref:CPBP family intramembrane glutamic endopeptidase n=1 Tax=Leptolyngbya sp. Cla-17 TaxID=2803751 RepID=UPI001931501D|nr:CPBP family intramembrane glutamic endopeptidase [Leptolyngbya sp. Cla-17]MBM0745067.1 CPBP family intramembrane metalloprotease [Leptolyngbya sp. Cla-17]
MTLIAAFVKRFPLITFFGLAYGFSWGSYAILSGPFLFPWGPWFAALIVASATLGKAGLNELLRRCLYWRVGLLWYIVVLTVPIAIALTAVALNLLMGAAVSTTIQLSPWYSFFFLFPLALFDAPLLEETGWRGYSLPQFPAERSPIANTLILAVLIAGWHVPIALSDRTLAAPYLITAIASAVVTNWVYYNTDGSALLAMVYHTAANTMGGAGFNVFQLFSGPDYIRAWWCLAAVNWMAALIVMLVSGPTLGRSQRSM